MSQAIGDARGVGASSSASAVADVFGSGCGPGLFEEDGADRVAEGDGAGVFDDVDGLADEDGAATSANPIPVTRWRAAPAKIATTTRIRLSTCQPPGAASRFEAGGRARDGGAEARVPHRRVGPRTRPHPG